MIFGWDLPYQMNLEIIINSGPRFSYGLSYKKNYKIRGFEPKRYFVWRAIVEMD